MTFIWGAHSIIDAKTRAERMPERGDLVDLLVRCSEFLDNYVDVIDGDYGEPRPNRAMSLKGDVDVMLEKMGI